MKNSRKSSQDKQSLKNANNRQIIRLSETNLLFYVADKIDPNLAPRLALLCDRIKQQFPDLIDVIPSYVSVMIEFHPSFDVSKLLLFLEQALDEFDNLKPSLQQKVIELPVYYHSEVAPDLLSVAQEKQLSVNEVIQIHTSQEYTVCAIGFTPGFAFLGVVDDKIKSSRHDEPRLRVPKGSVGIADNQTAVYPSDSPGGWKIIGNCPITLFDVKSDPISPFKVGDRVRFVPIDKSEFLKLGGQIEPITMDESR